MVYQYFETLKHSGCSVPPTQPTQQISGRRVEQSNTKDLVVTSYHILTLCYYCVCNNEANKRVKRHPNYPALWCNRKTELKCQSLFLCEAHLSLHLQWSIATALNQYKYIIASTLFELTLAYVTFFCSSSYFAETVTLTQE